MGKKDAISTGLPVDQYRKQIGKQDYKKSKPALKATRLKAEAKKYSSGFRDAFLVIAAILFFVLCVYAFFYLNLSTEINLDVDSHVPMFSPLIEKCKSPTEALVISRQTLRLTFQCTNLSSRISGDHKDCAVRWIRNSPVLCEVCGNARLSGFCCESHPPIAFLIPDALPNDTEIEELSGRAEKGRDKIFGARKSSVKLNINHSLFVKRIQVQVREGQADGSLSACRARKSIVASTVVVRQRGAPAHLPPRLGDIWLGFCGMMSALPPTTTSATTNGTTPKGEAVICSVFS
ncbi:hypothetical protein FQN60_007440 [Etheostoma spectabile]|uniref:Triple QxxK/R motif-containing protein n=1 Tax=Etheostoma spectabile TaxID=54343 RepID=A0A5J5D2V6_9PERO|nr:hypothetical protein FQN60_007440 [Etheostoma spectabile]